MSKRTKQILFMILSLTIGFINFKFLGHIAYWEKLLVRLPQILIMLWLYNKYIGRSSEILKFADKIRFKKNWIHYPLMTIGLVMLVGMFYIAGASGIGDMAADDPQAFVGEMKETSNAPWQALVFSFVIMLPFVILPVWSMANLLALTTKFVFWAFENNKRWFIPALLLEDLVLTMLFSLVR